MAACLEHHYNAPGEGFRQLSYRLEATIETSYRTNKVYWRDFNAHWRPVSSVVQEAVPRCFTLGEDHQSPQPPAEVTNET